MVLLPERATEAAPEPVAEPLPDEPEEIDIALPGDKEESAPVDAQAVAAEVEAFDRHIERTRR